MVLRRCEMVAASQRHRNLSRSWSLGRRAPKESRRALCQNLLEPIVQSLGATTCPGMKVPGHNSSSCAAASVTVSLRGNSCTSSPVGKMCSRPGRIRRIERCSRVARSTVPTNLRPRGGLISTLAAIHEQIKPLRGTTSKFRDAACSIDWVKTRACPRCATAATGR